MHSKMLMIDHFFALHVGSLDSVNIRARFEREGTYEGSVWLTDRTRVDAYASPFQRKQVVRGLNIVAAQLKRLLIDSVSVAMLYAILLC